MGDQVNDCDKVRRDVLDTLKYVDPVSCDAIVAMGKYYDKVDDRSTVNNFCDSIMAVTRNCEKMVNPKLWVPLHAQMNLEPLIQQLGFNWPKRAKENFRHIENIFSEIDESFQKKGLKSSKVPGVKQYEPSNEPDPPKTKQRESQKSSDGFNAANEEHNPILNDPRLKNIDKSIAERILNEIVDKKQDLKWDDIAGLDNVKQAINEIVVYPMQNPELFQGLLSPAKGLLLFGPPGTGKTLIGKCIASESGATFFAISASSLTSKWIGEGEKMVRALFAVARCMQPSVVFIDEIDSLLTQRTDGECDATRRLKTEFLVQFDGVATGAEDRLLIVGATNRPQELDEAARRRFTKRLYIPLPEDSARKQLIKTLMKSTSSNLTEECIDYVVEKTVGFSGADMATLCKEAALMSIKMIIASGVSLQTISKDKVPPITIENFKKVLIRVKPSVSSNALGELQEWDRQFGACRED